jgi:hypothetical protein
MKIWFEYCGSEGYLTDEKIWLGIGGYEHSPFHKWKGYTLQIYFFRYIFFINYVDNYVEYSKRMNIRYSDQFKNKDTK